MNQLRDSLDVLELSPTATQAEVKQAYRELVMVWHPDRFPNGSPLADRASTKFKEIDEAYRYILQHGFKDGDYVFYDDPSAAGDANPEGTSDSFQEEPPRPPSSQPSTPPEKKFPVALVIVAIVICAGLGYGITQVIFSSSESTDPQSNIVAQAEPPAPTTTNVSPTVPTPIEPPPAEPEPPINPGPAPVPPQEIPDSPSRTQAQLNDDLPISPPAGDFVDMFNGKDLTNWEGSIGYWKVENGILVGDSNINLEGAPSRALFYRGEKMGNYELRIRYRITKGSSRIHFRSHENSRRGIIGPFISIDPRNLSPGISNTSSRDESSTLSNFKARSRPRPPSPPPALGEWIDMSLIADGNVLEIQWGNTPSWRYSVLGRDPVQVGVIAFELIGNTRLEIQAARIRPLSPPPPHREFTPDPIVDDELPILAGGVEPEFKQLLNGENLTGWIDINSRWRYRDGRLIGSSRSISKTIKPAVLLLNSSALYNFELRLSFRRLGGAGGICFHSKAHQEARRVSGLQFEISPDAMGRLAHVDETGVHSHRGIGKRVNDRDRWQDVVIRVTGNKVVHTINGDSIEYTIKPGAGTLALSVGGPHAKDELSEVEFTNIRLRSLP